MHQKLFIKSTAFKMGMLRNGWSSSKSLSPGTMQEAFAEIVNSTNLLPLGSRQSVIDTSGVNTLELKSNLSIINHRSLSFREYLSNFWRNKTFQL